MSTFINVATDVWIAGAFSHETDLQCYSGFLYCCPDAPDDTGYTGAEEYGFEALRKRLPDVGAVWLPLSVPLLPATAFPEGSQEEDERVFHALKLYGKYQEALASLPRPLLISCKSNRRAGFVWAVFDYLDHLGQGDEKSVAAYVEACKEKGILFGGTPQLLLLFNTIVVHITRVKSSNGLLFRQLFDKASSTYTYLLADMESKQAILIDPVMEMAERDAKLITQLGLMLVLGVNTHVHADHITGTGKLKALLPSARSAIARISTAQADVLFDDYAALPFGSRRLFAISTPGHTQGCTSFVLFEAGSTLVFTGDALLIRGCGRTDFQGGSAETLYDSVHSRLFTLPKSAVVWPAHNYEVLHNPRPNPYSYPYPYPYPNPNPKRTIKRTTNNCITLDHLNHP